jgi:hypothetical protein
MLFFCLIYFAFLVEFWGFVMQEFELVSQREQKRLQQAVQAGIPNKLRGPIWGMMSRSKIPELEREFQRLLPLSSPFEKLIQRDLARTFPSHPFFADAGGRGQEGLFNVVKAYSLFDPEVGYCQGISFVAGPLLINVRAECNLITLIIFFE